MARRAAICIGVNRPAGMPALAGCSEDARAFEAWAKAQGIETTLLADTGAAGEVLAKIEANAVFDAVEAIVKRASFHQLIVYFSGHGILLAPGAEFWMLSRGPNNPNEAVNLMRSVEDSRNTGIPHIVFVSDACRSAADSPLLRAVTGSLIFPPLPTPHRRSEIDVYYATLPGDPANEVAAAEAAGRRGLFTTCLLQALKQPPAEIVESTLEGGVELLHVLSSRRLKDHLEAVVPDAASAISIKLNQSPELRVETALPKYFARVDAPTAPANSMLGATAAPPAARPSVDSMLAAIALSRPATRPAVGGLLAGATPATSAMLAAAERTGMLGDVNRMAALRGRARFETMTGFSVHGADVVSVVAPAWQADAPFAEAVDSLSGPVTAQHVRLSAAHSGPAAASSILLALSGDIGVVLPVLPGFVGTVVVDAGRVSSVNYVPSAQSSRHADYQQHADAMEHMKALAAVASRMGRFYVEDSEPSAFASRVRQGKGIDPTLGLYAAYAYAQAGEFDKAFSVFAFMRDDEPDLPIPFDVAMLALRAQPNAAKQPGWRVAPFLPMLSQGWTLLAPGDTMHRPIHQRLRPHLVPSLFTTLGGDGVRIARDALVNQEEA